MLHVFKLEDKLFWSTVKTTNNKDNKEMNKGRKERRMKKLYPIV